MIGCVFVAVFGLNYFALLNTKLPALIFVAVALSGLPIRTMYGPDTTLIAESLSPRLRYTGSSLGYQLPSVIAGGPSPFIATALLAFLRLELSDYPLHPGLRGYRNRRDGAACGLHQQRYLGGIRQKSTLLAVYHYGAVCHLSVELPRSPFISAVAG